LGDISSIVVMSRLSRLPTKRFTHRSQRLNVPKADDCGGFTADAGRGLEVGGGWWGCVDL